MSEILKKRLRESIGNKTKIFLHNGFKFEGRITNCDDKYVELLEERGYKIIELIDISDVDIYNEELRKDALEYRRKKLREIKEKIKKGIATEEEISFIKFWKEVFGKNAF